MNNEKTKIFMEAGGKKNELPLYDDMKELNYPTLEDYTDFVMGINGEKFNVKILKSDFEKIKNIFR